jgi:hypothetical protein
MEKSAMRKVDPTKRGVIQSGWVEDPPEVEPKKVEEQLSPEAQIEKKIKMKLLMKWIPGFPVKKLEKQSLGEINEFFDIQVIPAIQDLLVEKYKDISP